MARFLQCFLTGRFLVWAARGSVARTSAQLFGEGGLSTVIPASVRIKGRLQDRFCMWMEVVGTRRDRIDKKAKDHGGMDRCHHCLFRGVCACQRPEQGAARNRRHHAVLRHRGDRCGVADIHIHHHGHGNGYSGLDAHAQARPEEDWCDLAGLCRRRRRHWRVRDRIVAAHGHSRA